MKIQLHSMTDLITNSSTVIYTYSDASLDACKKMINEIFKTFNIDKTCNDVFDLSVDLEDNCYYNDALCDLDDEDIPVELKEFFAEDSKADWKERDKALDTYIAKVNRGEIKKPEWMEEAEGERSDGYKPSNTLTIQPKLPEYKKLAKLIKDFLYSTTNEAGYDG
jgi:hypothetical protein